MVKIERREATTRSLLEGAKSISGGDFLDFVFALPPCLPGE